MTKTVPSALQAHLDSGATTMALCWKVARTDGVVQGFTEHDCDLTFDGTTYLARSGFTASAVNQTLGLSVDNLNVDGAISSDTINEDDLASGRYDDAEVELLWVNWSDPTNPDMRMTMSRGHLGEIKREETAFSAEFRSLVNKLAQNTGRSYQRTCDAQIGDSRCKVNLESAAHKGTGTVTSSAGRNLVLNGLGAFDDGWFTHGTIKFTSGDNAGLTFEVKSHAGANVTLWDVPPSPVVSTTTFEIRAGCQQDMFTCRDKFNNIYNFQGFYDIPGQDYIQKVAVQGEAVFDGGSLRSGES